MSSTDESHWVESETKLTFSDIPLLQSGTFTATTLTYYIVPQSIDSEEVFRLSLTEEEEGGFSARGIHNSLSNKST